MSTSEVKVHLRIRIEISDDQAEEIVIRCREQNDTVKAIEHSIETALKGTSELILYINGTEYYVPREDILFFESDGTRIYANTNGKKYATTYRLFELENIMPSYFVRISKSVIANVKSISSLRREVTGNGEITFKNCEKKTYFSRGYYKKLREKIEEVRFSK